MSINSEKCVGCGDCIKFSTYSVFKSIANVAYPVEPENCKGCKDCLEECKVKAITVFRLVDYIKPK